MKKFLMKCLAVAVIAGVLMLIPAIALLARNPKRPVVAEFLLMDVSGNISPLSARDYVIGAVAAEMPSSFEVEALKAQAVAAYTFAVRRQSQNGHITSDPATFQAYISNPDMQAKLGDGFAGAYGKIAIAVDKVLGQVLLYDNQPIVAAYHAMSGGKTENAAALWGSDVPYLRAVDSEGDAASPALESAVAFTAAQVAETLGSADIAVTSRSESGTVLTSDVGGKTMTGAQIRTALGLKSPNFEIRQDGDSIQIVCKGYGHGIGMSQNGANAMAKQGYSYQDILRHYYTGVEICR